MKNKLLGVVCLFGFAIVLGLLGYGCKSSTEKGIQTEPELPARVVIGHSACLSGEYAKAFLAYTSLFPVGSFVELSDERRGKVIRANGYSFAKPVVSVLADAKGNALGEHASREDLAKNTDVQIIRALSADLMPGFGAMEGF